MMRWRSANPCAVEWMEQFGLRNIPPDVGLVCELVAFRAVTGACSTVAEMAFALNVDIDQARAWLDEGVELGLLEVVP